MTESQLSLFNGALRILGERKLASLTEAREPQRVLTDIWNDGKGAIWAMLEKGFWKFAIRSASMTYSPSITPSFGYQFAFNKGTDWVRTVAVCSDPYFNQPLTQYDDEGGYLYCDFSTIYVKWVSNDASYGGDTTKWTEKFINYFEHYLAYRGCFRITMNKAKEADIKKDYESAGVEARSHDAIEGPTKFMPTGSWAGARRGRFSFRNRNNDSGYW